MFPCILSNQENPPNDDSQYIQNKAPKSWLKLCAHTHTQYMKLDAINAKFQDEVTTDVDGSWRAGETAASLTMNFLYTKMCTK